MKRRLRALLEALGLGFVFTVRDALRNLDPRRLRRRVRFRRLNRRAASGEIVLRPGLSLRIDPASREPFEWFCFRSPEMASELDAFVRAMATARRFVDIGACHGIFSLAFTHGRPQAVALAVEPSPTAFAILAENARLNAPGNVVVRQLALGASAGPLRMRANWHHLEAVAAGESDDTTLEVPMSTLDALCSELDFHPELLKIDVEGFEGSVLAGAQEILRRDRPLLFLEVHPQRLRELGRSTADLLASLQELGYRFLSLEGRPLALARLAARQAVFRLCCTPPR